MAPSSPKRAPEAPTEIVDSMNKPESKLPPIPEITYNGPILPVKQKERLDTRLKFLKFESSFVALRIMHK